MPMEMGFGAADKSWPSTPPLHEAAATHPVVMGKPHDE